MIEEYQKRIENSKT